MNVTCKRLSAALLALLMLISAAACTGSEDPADTHIPNAEVTTDEVTLPAPEDYEITEKDGTASVTTPLGLTYTLTGYTALDKATATVGESLTYTLEGEAFEEKFNRFTLTYSATAPVKVWVTYTERGKSAEEYFFLDAKEGQFSGLNTGFMKGYSARKLTALRVEPLTDKATAFTLAGVYTEKLEKLPKTYYLESDRYKLGIDLGWGGTVSYLEDKACTIPDLVNLVNRHDTGRLIQQSFYGVQENDEYTPGISFDSKWRYNPVQGGDQYNNPSRLIDVVITANSLYIRSQPQDWSLDNALTPSYYENTYTLDGDCVKVDNRFTDYSGWEHPFAGQELPAFYTVSYLDTFVWYNGEEPWTGDALSSKNDLPFWGDHAGECTFVLREKNTETWCAWVSGGDDYGLGVYVPNIDQHKAGRYEFDGSKSDMAGSTGYVAPINILKLVSFDPIEYSYLLTAGNIATIRETFTARKDFTDNADLRVNYQSSRLPSVDGDITKLDFTGGQNLALLTNPMDTAVVYDEAMGAVKLTAGSVGDVSVTIPYGSSPTPLAAESYKTLKIEYMIPTDASKPSYQSDLFICTGNIKAPDGNARIRVNLVKDGEYHVLEVKLAGNAYWTGDIHMIRIDYFDTSSAGDVMYIKNISLE
jgi:hypothetical protein